MKRRPSRHVFLLGLILLGKGATLRLELAQIMANHLC
jgi:hypothetical protein